MHSPLSCFNLNLHTQLFVIAGSQEFPVENVMLENLVLTGTSRSDLEPHGIPSAGDWVGRAHARAVPRICPFFLQPFFLRPCSQAAPGRAHPPRLSSIKGLERLAAVRLTGTKGVSISNCTFERVDGNGIMVHGYNRNATISHNDFRYIGNRWGWEGKGGKGKRDRNGGSSAAAVPSVQRQPGPPRRRRAPCQTTHAAAQPSLVASPISSTPQRHCTVGRHGLLRRDRRRAAPLHDSVGQHLPRRGPLPEAVQLLLSGAVVPEHHHAQRHVQPGARGHQVCSVAACVFSPSWLGFSHFHPPLFSFNDGLGGGSESSYNLLFNACRESSVRGSLLCQACSRGASATLLTARPATPRITLPSTRGVACPL